MLQTSFIYAKNGDFKIVFPPFTIAQYKALEAQKAERQAEANRIILAATTTAIRYGKHTADILQADRFEHATLKNSDGTPLRARRNGKTKTWKTKPGTFQIPAKYGLKECFYITQDNAHEWNVAN